MGIPDSLSCIPDYKAKDSGFHSKNFPDSAIWIPLHGVKPFNGLGGGGGEGEIKGLLFIAKKEACFFACHQVA